MIYLSGRMSGIPTSEAKAWRSEFKRNVMRYGDGKFDVFDPTFYYNYDTLRIGDDIPTDREIFRYEHNMLLRSKVVVCNLKGIEHSVGTINEIAWAYDRGIPIIGFDAERSINQINEETHPWILQEMDKIYTGEDVIESAAIYAVVYFEMVKE